MTRVPLVRAIVRRDRKDKLHGRHTTFSLKLAYLMAINNLCPTFCEDETARMEVGVK